MVRYDDIVLTCTEANHNKFYIITPIKPDGSLEVRYGAINSRNSQSTIYRNGKDPSTLMNEKLKKGYNLLNTKYRIGDILTIRKRISKSDEEVFVIENYISTLPHFIKVVGKHEMLCIPYSSILYDWKYDDNNPSLEAMTMKVLLDIRKEWMTSRGYLK